MRITRRGLGLGLASLGATGRDASAQGAGGYPSRQLTWIVPFTPAGITDINSRLFARKLGARLGQTVIIDNRPGAGGTLGTDAAARAAPDGYTMVYGTQGTLCTAPALFRRLPYDPVRSFIPIQGMFETANVLVAHPSRPYRSVEGLIAYAKANPGKVNYGTAGVATGTHLTMVLFQIIAGIQMTHVPYPGSGPAITDLIAGVTDVMFDYAVATRDHVENGRMRGLAVTSKERIPALPDVPTVIEAGFPEAVSGAWSGILLPAGSPPEVVEKLTAEAAAVMQDAEIRRAAEMNGSRPLTELTRDRFAAFIQAELPRWAEIVRRSGAQPS